VQETVESGFFVIAVLVFVVVLPLMGLWKLRAKRNRRLAADTAAANERHMRSLRQPDYAAFAAHYGCQPPPPLRQLYESPESNLAGGFEVKLASFPNPFLIAGFIGMDQENLSLELPGTEKFFAFADDGCGNLYIVNPRKTDPVVYFHDHEMNEPESLEVSLSQFLAAKRTKAGRWG
jgi:hypothetical protein